ncbi:MAG: MoxR family ATPase [Anaerolineales bacterium]|nr:MoxR family ATPase [Anaerolineales bacterium]
MYGMDEVIKLCLVALIADGHVLLEANPGFGKTTLVKTLAQVLRLPWGRVQFTPDLMPSDITGTFMPRIPRDDEDNSNTGQMDSPIPMTNQAGIIFYT